MCHGGETGQDLILPLVKFAYNNAINRSTSKSPFETVHGYSPRTPSNLIPLPPNVQVSQLGVTFPQHMHDMHAKICSLIAMSNDSHKLSADVRRSDISFKVGDFVMAIFVLHDYLNTLTKKKKLHARAMDPYEIINKLESNAYVLDLHDNLGISPIFNVQDLTLH